MRKTSWKPRAEWPTQCTTENHHPVSNPSSPTALSMLSSSLEFKILACPGAACPHTFTLPFIIKVRINRFPSVVLPASDLSVRVSIIAWPRCPVICIPLSVSPPRFELLSMGTRAPAWQRCLFGAGHQWLLNEPQTYLRVNSAAHCTKVL